MKRELIAAETGGTAPLLPDVPHSPPSPASLSAASYSSPSSALALSSFVADSASTYVSTLLELEPCLPLLSPKVWLNSVEQALVAAGENQGERKEPTAARDLDLARLARSSFCVLSSSSGDGCYHLVACFARPMSKKEKRRQKQKKEKEQKQREGSKQEKTATTESVGGVSFPPVPQSPQETQLYDAAVLVLRGNDEICEGGALQNVPRQDPSLPSIPLLFFLSLYFSCHGCMIVLKRKI